MREVEFVACISKLIDPRRNAELAQAVVQGLTCSLPEPVQDRFAQPLWSWTCNPAPAPDMLLGDDADRGVAVLEAKGPRTPIQWTARRFLRQATLGSDDESRRIAGHYLDHAEARLDVAHHDIDCTASGDGCGAWKHSQPRASGGDLHYPVVHQGDLYASTPDYIPPGLAVDDLRNLTFLFLAPTHASVARWRDGLTATAWHTVMLPGVAAYWRFHSRRLPSLQPLISATDQFLASY